jgi:hypothetical protein
MLVLENKSFTANASSEGPNDETASDDATVPVSRHDD